MRFPLFLLALSLAACTIEIPDDGLKVEIADDTAGGIDDTDDTDGPLPPAAGSIIGHVETGPCIQGQDISLNLGDPAPYGYHVEVQYNDSSYEPMQSSIHMRPSLAILNGDGALTVHESPIYREGSTLYFTCGYKWEDNPRIDGVLVDGAASYRVSWFTATP